jgi:hypothetical protein
VDRTDVYFGDIVKGKTEELDDGTIMVYGKAAGPDLDLDQQRCDPAWLKRAVPEWMTWGNVREQHGAIAAGVGKALTGQGDDWYLRAHVVDPVTVKKVQAGVLKGFSVGIRNYRTVVDATAPKGRIVDGIIPEISLVDRPSNPTAVMSIAKSAGSALAPVDMAGVVITLDGEETGKAAGSDPWAWARELDADSRTALLKALGANDKGKRKASATIIDSQGGAPGGDTDKSATADASKATGEPTGDAKGLITADTVKALIAEATAERDAKIAALETRLDKALAAPAPGGPVILAPSQGANPQQSEATKAAALAAHYRATAAKATDPTVKAGYEREAARLESVAA